MSWSSTSISAPYVEPEILQSYAYYHVRGADLNTLWAHIQQGGPVGYDGQHYVGFSPYHVSWNYPTIRDARGCSTGPVMVTVTITFQLPRWDRPASAPYDLVQRWNKFTAALLAHEQNHKQIVVESARGIAAALPAIPPQPSCDLLKSAAENAGRGYLWQAYNRNVEYDDRTQHGVTEGARMW